LKLSIELTKLYYTIGEVAEMFSVSTSLIRYWETEFPSLKPKKDRRGDRKFTKKDIEQLEEIYTLVKERGFTLEGAKKEIKENKHVVNPSVRDNEVLAKLKKIRKGIQDLHDSI
jgi:DNA-binding transcriptional MerR regulator